MPHSIPDVNLITGFVVRPDFGYVLTEGEVTKDGVTSGVMLKWSGGGWSVVHLPFLAPICVDVVPGADPKRPGELTAISVAGDFLRTGTLVQREEGKIDPTPNGPSARGWIRDLKRVGPNLYAVGMKRQAYLREPGASWRHIDQGIAQGLVAEKEQLSGLNGVDGFSPEEVYAGGLEGEIWRWDGARWHAVHSPTNAPLNAVHRSGDFIYMAGGSGVVLRGRGDDFEVVATEDDKANLYGLHGFGGEVYVASQRKVYRLKDGALEEVDFGLGEPVTTGSLHAAGGVLWSLGVHHLVSTKDGVTWSQLFM
jgi:hypothetical protein